MKKIIVLILLFSVIIILFFYQERNMNTLISNEVTFKYEVDDSINNGIIENINMEYIECGIGEVKLNSVKMSKISTELLMSFKSYKINNFEYCCAIFDNKGNIYSFWCPNSFHSNYKNINKEIVKFCKKHNIKYDAKWGNLKSSGVNENDLEFISNKEDVRVARLSSCSDIGFANSRNPYIEMNQQMGNICYVELWDPKGNDTILIELDLPKNFYQNSQIEYKQMIKSDIFKSNVAICDDKAFLLVAEIDGFNDMRNDYITGENGKMDMKKFNEWLDNEMEKRIYISDGSGEKYFYLHNKPISFVPVNNSDRVALFFNLNSSNTTESIYVHLNLDDSEKIIELRAKDKAN